MKVKNPILFLFVIGCFVVVSVDNVVCVAGLTVELVDVVVSSVVAILVVPQKKICI